MTDNYINLIVLRANCPGIYEEKRIDQNQLFLKELDQLIRDRQYKPNVVVVYFDQIYQGISSEMFLAAFEDDGKVSKDETELIPKQKNLPLKEARTFQFQNQIIKKSQKKQQNNSCANIIEQSPYVQISDSQYSVQEGNQDYFLGDLSVQLQEEILSNEQQNQQNLSQILSQIQEQFLLYQPQYFVQQQYAVLASHRKNN